MRGLNAPPRSAVAPAAFTALAAGQDLLFAFHRAGTGDHADRAVAHRQAAGADRGRFAFDFQAGDFVGGQDRHHFGHAGSAFQRFFVGLAIVAHRGDHGSFGADDHVGLQTQRLDALDHVLDVGGEASFFMTTITVRSSAIRTVRWGVGFTGQKQKKPRDLGSSLGALGSSLPQDESYVPPPAPRPGGLKKYQK